MTKTIAVSDEIHQLIWKKWIELRNKGKNIKLGKVAEAAVILGIDSVKEELQLKKDE